MAKQAMIGVKPETKKALDKAKVHVRETYDDVISRLVKKRVDRKINETND